MKRISVSLFFVGMICICNAQHTTLSQLHNTIDSAYDARDYELTIKKCDAALAIKSTDSAATLRKATSLFYLHRIEDCIAFAEKNFQPADSGATMLGILSLQDDERSATDSAVVFADREKLVTNALKLNSNNGYANLGQCLLLVEAKDFETGLQYVDKAISEVNESIKPGFRMVKAALFGEWNKNEEADAEIKSVIAAYPDYENAYQELVKSYRSEKKYQEAFNALQLHSEHFGKEAEDRDIKFYILKNWGKKEEACSLAKEMGDDNTYVKDAAGDMGCAWLSVHLNNNKGAEYKYSVSAAGDEYDFTVTRTEGDYNSELSFDWFMSNYNQSSGSITLTKAALDNATEQMNKFSGGKDNEILSDVTSVWISRAVFNALKEKGEATMSVDGQWRDFKVATKDQEENYEVDYYNGSVAYNGEEDKRIQTIHIYSDDNDKYQLWINDDAANPMIIKMNIDFGIELKEVKE